MGAVDDILLTVPNVSEGRDKRVIAAIGDAFGATGARRLDVHSDPDHHRTVFTLAGGVDEIVTALLAGARACRERGHQFVYAAGQREDGAVVVGV